MTKTKGHQKYWRMKIEKNFGKRYIYENFPQSENFSKIGGNLKQREMHHGLRGDGRPCPQLFLKFVFAG